MENIQLEIDEIKYIGEILRTAGLMAQKMVDKGVTQQIKKDGSPVTNVDVEIQNYILGKLRDKKSPVKNYNLICEECKSNKISNKFITIDPIDGTRHLFTDHNYTIMVGKVEDNNVSYGIVYYPKKEMLFIGHTRMTVVIDYSNNSIEEMKLSSTSDLSKATILIGTTDFVKYSKELEKLKKMLNIKIIGSTGLKASLVASGVADGYILFPRAMTLWDIVPSYAVVKHCGGKITDLHGNKLNLNNIISKYGAIISNGKIHEDLLKVVNSVLSLNQQNI